MLRISPTIFSWVITTLLTGLTVAAGLLSTWYEHRDRQKKMKRTGWWLGGLIVAFGIGSIASNAYERILNDAKEKADAAQRAKQFDAQMTKLTEATASLTRLRSDMTESLGKEQELFAKSDLNLGVVTDVQKQQVTSTDSILRRVFDESNHVAVEQISVFVSVNCTRMKEKYVQYPQATRVSIVLKRHDLQTISLTTETSVKQDGGDIFFRFLGEIGSFERLQAWRGAHVDMIITENVLGIGIMSLGELSNLTDAERYEKENPILPKSCPLSASLLRNGRSVLHVSGILEKQSNSGSRAYEAIFNSAPVESSLLPSFREFSGQGVPGISRN